MKLFSPALALVFLSSTLPILVAAQSQCEACQALKTMKSCTQGLADQYTLCMNSSCDQKPTNNPLDNCMGNVTDQSPITGETTATSTTKGALTTTMPTSKGNLSTTTSPNATSSGPKTTVSAAAAPAFGGIGFGGGAAAMVGLAGLVGLVL